MTQDNTKDLVRVLREIANMLDGYAYSYEAMARQNPDDPTVRMGDVAVDIRQNMMAFVLERIAAIPHSEQRETVAAGEVDADELHFNAQRLRNVGRLVGVDVGGDDAMADSCRGAILGTIASAIRRAALVAAPVPEAKAEQATDEYAYDEAANLAKAIYSQHYREGTEQWRVLPDIRGVISQISNMVAGMTRARPAAPAVKHEASEPVWTQAMLDQVQVEAAALGAKLQRKPLADEASELPPLVDLMKIIHSAGVMAADSSHINVAEAAYRAALAAPPIAVQGSIGDDAEFLRLLDAWLMGKYDYMATGLNDLVAYIDSRPPVAAAPSDGRGTGTCDECGKAQQDGFALYCADHLFSASVAAAPDKNASRLAFLHSTNKDADGWEYGVAKVRWGVDGRPEVLWALSDHSDIDAAIRALSAAAPSADAKGEAS